DLAVHRRAADGLRLGPWGLAGSRLVSGLATSGGSDDPGADGIGQSELHPACTQEHLRPRDQRGAAQADTLLRGALHRRFGVTRGRGSPKATEVVPGQGRGFVQRGEGREAGWLRLLVRLGLRHRA
ncbi:unnamed protein product, partial [Symbiodinium sp. KB8]